MNLRQILTTRLVALAIVFGICSNPFAFGSNQSDQSNKEQEDAKDLLKRIDAQIEFAKKNIPILLKNNAKRMANQKNREVSLHKIFDLMQEIGSFSSKEKITRSAENWFMQEKARLDREFRFGDKDEKQRRLEKLKVKKEEMIAESLKYFKDFLPKFGPLLRSYLSLQLYHVANHLDPKIRVQVMSEKQLAGLAEAKPASFRELAAKILMIECASYSVDKGQNKTKSKELLMFAKQLGQIEMKKKSDIQPIQFTKDYQFLLSIAMDLTNRDLQDLLRVKELINQITKMTKEVEHIRGLLNDAKNDREKESMRNECRHLLEEIESYAKQIPVLNGRLARDSSTRFAPLIGKRPSDRVDNIRSLLKLLGDDKLVRKFNSIVEKSK